MNILFQNYTSELTTEPMYLNGCFNQVGVNSNIWNSNVGVYDTMDSVRPDVLVLHYRNMTNDLFKYLVQNKRHKCDVVLNVTGASQEDFSKMEQILIDSGISCPFFFTNVPQSLQSVVSSKTKVLNLLPAADTFLVAADSGLNFHVEAAIISMGAPDLVDAVATKYKTFHKLKFLGGSTPDEKYDLPVTVMNLVNLYDHYDHVWLVDRPEVIFTQLFFDAALRVKRLYIQTFPDQREKLTKVFETSLFKMENDVEDFGELIRRQVKEKHTCYSRAARFAKQLKLTDAADKLQQVVEQ